MSQRVRNIEISVEGIAGKEMARKVWFQLVDAATRAVYADTVAGLVRLPEEAEYIADFSEAVFAKVSRALPVNVIAANLRVYANRAAYDVENAQPLPPRTPLIGLGDDELIVEVPQRERGEIDSYLCKDGINPLAPHLKREELLSRVYAMRNHRFILFLSPAASGKSSLLSLFARRYPDLKCIYASFINPEISAADNLRSCGIDIDNKTTTNLDPSRKNIVMLDDAQAKYHETGFWSTLIKGAPYWLPGNITFIICATHALEGGVDSPEEFQSLVTFGRNNFLLSDEEAHEFLALPLPIGLPNELKKQHFMELLIRECNGLIGALRISVDAVVACFAESRATSETDLVSYYLSQDSCIKWHDALVANT